MSARNGQGPRHGAHKPRKRLLSAVGAVALTLAVSFVGYLVLSALGQHGNQTAPQGGGQSHAAPVSPGASQRPPAHIPPEKNLIPPREKELLLEMVDTSENSTTAWWKQYAYIQNIGDKRGYTAGLVGFCSGTGDMLQVLQKYHQFEPGNSLDRYIPELRRLDVVYGQHGYKTNKESAFTGGLPGFVAAWKLAADDPAFRAAQRWERDTVYFNPAIKRALKDHLGRLGQYVYFDTAVNMGGVEYSSFHAMRREAMAIAPTPTQGGSERAYLKAFLQVRLMHMHGYGPVRRVIVQRQFLKRTASHPQGNLQLVPPFSFRMYKGDYYTINTLPQPHLP